MTADQIRSKFLAFFKSKGHTIVASASLVPPEAEDKTVLFTTAGMQQFKRQFLGHITDFSRAATSQKCIRTDDLDQVGKTAFHHTFFEMLGNFSFGDYFKKDAILWAWEFLTREMQIPAEKLWVSVYKEDDEAYKIWLNEVKVPANRVIKLGDKSNFWPSQAPEKGPNGPCGPCSEIFFDYGQNPACPNGNRCDPDCDCGRFSEIWNLVFTQFNRKEGGVLEPLPGKNIDTGMGLERLCAVAQGKKSNFETDLFEPIIQAIEKETSTNGYSLNATDKHIIADHIRAIVFGINDGVMPTNEGRGYVIKRLIIDATNKLIPLNKQDKNKARLNSLVPVVAGIMKNPYPEITNKINEISTIIRKIQESYLVTRNKRGPESESRAREIMQSDIPREQKVKKLGQQIFLSHDTYGLSIDDAISITLNAASAYSDLQLRPDELMKETNEEMDQQRNRSRAGSKMTGDVFTDATLDLKGLKTIFLGHEKLSAPGKILKIFKDDQEVSEARKGDRVRVVLDQTSFYAESGGQVGDKGTISVGNAKVRIDDTQKISDVVLHVGEVIDGAIKNNATAEASVDEKRRSDIMRNHTATHLLQAALRNVLGTHVQQQGSVVDDERLRFDFTHPTALTPAQIQAIENFVYETVLACRPVSKENLSLEEAKQRGALAFFAEKYGNTVRVVSVEGCSKELCGGTHLNNTGEIGLFKIVSEGAIAQGIRRIEAKTGWGALEWMNSRTEQLQALSRLLKAPEAEILERIMALSNRVKQLEKDCQKYRFTDIKNNIDILLKNAPVIKGATIFRFYMGDIDIENLRKTCDLVELKTKTAVVVLGSTFNVLVGVTADLVKKGVNADDIINQINPLIGGSGGGRPSMAQAGSKETNKIRDAVTHPQVMALIEEKLKSI